MAHRARFFTKKNNALKTISCPEIKIQIEEQDIPFVPRNVRIKHLTPEGLLLNPYIATKADAELKTRPDGRYSKGVGDSPFGSLKLNGQNLSVYYGVRHRGAPIGKGAYGKVKSVQNRAGEWLALKVQEDECDEEYQFLSQLGWTVGPVIQRQKGDDAPVKYNLLMKYVRGINLESLLELHSSGRIKVHPLRWLDLLIQLFEKVEVIHDNEIVHADLKPANIIYDLITKLLTVADFGGALKLDSNKTAESSDLFGTNEYMAPELIAMDAATGKARWSPRTDMYACGRILKMVLGIPDTLEEYKLVAKLTEQREEILRKSKASESKSKDDQSSSKDKGKKTASAHVDYEKEWKKNPYITNKTPFSFDAELTRLAQALADPRPKFRTRNKKAAKKLRAYRERVANYFPVKVGILHFDYFKGLHADEKRIFLKELKKYDEILLVNDQLYPRNKFKESAVALRWLIDAGITLSHDKILVSPQMNLLVARIPHYFSERNKKENTLRHYEYCNYPHKQKNVSEKTISRFRLLSLDAKPSFADKKDDKVIPSLRKLPPI